jgi:hypothetical protein
MKAQGAAVVKMLVDSLLDFFAIIGSLGFLCRYILVDL